MDTQIILFGIWVVVMLIYLLGDVIRIFSGHFKPGEIEGKKMSQLAWLGISVLMLIPILMAFFSLVLEQSINRGANIIIAGLFFVFNIVGIPTYKGHYDKFLIAVSLIFNLITIYVAWNWI